MATLSSVVWPPIVVRSGEATLTIRQATQQDVPMLERWDRDPEVIACVTDDPTSPQAFIDAVWCEEIAANSDVTCYYIAELDRRPIGGIQVIDPHLEPTHYWGEIEPNLRAIDIWIGDDRDRNAGHGRAMMEAVIDRCFAEPAIAAIVIDPLTSNTEAHRFYRRLGFQVVGRRMFGDDDCLVHRLERADWREGN
ncbi:MAG: GNAT family N-acetyltransferase [Phycisphaerales bacterium]|nr:GNAT family N-acetyltransferase [Hyphomonadaceae bacterium]